MTDLALLSADDVHARLRARQITLVDIREPDEYAREHIDGAVSLAESGDQLARFKAAGWAVKAIDGHDYGQIRRALAWATKQNRPSLIA